MCLTGQILKDATPADNGPGLDVPNLLQLLDTGRAMEAWYHPFPRGLA